MALEITESGGISACGRSIATGIAFGFTAGMPYTPRQRDRREAVSDLLASLTRAMDRRLDVSLMRGAFEAALGQLIPVKSVHLREVGDRVGSRLGAPGPESVALEVPG